MLNFEEIKLWYDYGIWTAELVRMAADQGFITQSQADEILRK